MNMLGEAIRKAREAAGLSQESLAQILGMARTNYVKVETKGLAGEALLAKLAAISELGLSMDRLMALKSIQDFSPETILKAYEILIKEDPEKYRSEIAEIERRVKAEKKKK